MPVTLHWFLPTSGDARTVLGALGDAGAHHRRADRDGGERPADIAYLGQIARAAEQSGFEACLTPTGSWCEDAWLTTAALTQLTTKLKFLVAFRPGLLSPTLAAQMAATYQRLSGGRLLLNVVTGGDKTEQERFGDYLSKDERYARTGEFLDVVRNAWSGEPYDFHGEHVQVSGALVPEPPDPIPGIYFGGSSPAALDVAARHADVYLTWGEPPELVREKVEWMRRLAAAQGRRLRFGLRIHTLSRDTSEEAWRHAQCLLDGLDPATVARAQAAMGASESTGQQRMTALRGGRTSYADAHELEVSPNLWSGVGLVRGGAGTALVGSHEEVADRLEEYARIGIDEFILSGYPHVEEAWSFGEGVMPVLRRRGLYGEPSPAPAPRPVAASA